MEQMPGGKFQITARTASGADTFVSTVKTSLAEGQACLEEARRSFGGEGDGGSVESYDSIAQTWGRTAGVAEPVEEVFARPEPRIPTFTFADIEAPELPTSVR